MKSLPAYVIFMMALFSHTALAGPSAQEIDEASRIVSSSKGTVLKWEYSPTVGIVHDKPFDPAELKDVMNFIQENSGFEMVISHVTNVSNRKTQQQLSFDYVKLDDTVFGELSAPGEPARHASINIFFVDNLLGSLFFLLSEGGSSPLSLPKQFANGSLDCYFRIHSKNGEILAANIFIKSTIDSETLELCIYEELTQSMGLPNDAIGSHYFSYDNLATKKSSANDWKLLKALYSEDLAPGDSVRKFLEAYKTLPEER